MAHQYVEAGQILDKLLASEKGVSLRSLLYTQKRNPTTIPALHALVTETLKFKKILDTIITTINMITPKNKWLEREGCIMHVMLYDLLIGKQQIMGGGKIKKELLNHKAALHSAFVRMKLKAAVRDADDLIPPALRLQDSIPRYVRINKLKASPAEVMAVLGKEGYSKVSVTEVTGQTRGTKVYAIDPDIGDGALLVFPPFTDLHDHQLVLLGKVVLQDKASTFSGYILAPPPNTHAIDCCAAPGNKTSQMSESMKDTGTVFAFDKDPKRLETLVRLTKRNGITNINAQCADFLTVSPQDPKYAQVTHILCDPSCSGSGIVGRLDDLVAYAGGKSVTSGADSEQDVDLEQGNRLASLQDFQIKVILHASKFPQVQSILYSTCSVHQEENEDVVIKVLDQLGGQFELSNALPNWPRRGRYEPSKDSEAPPEHILQQLPYCVRTDPKIDFVTGFFVAVFVRKTGVAKTTTETEGEEIKPVEKVSWFHKKPVETKMEDIVLPENPKKRALEVTPEKKANAKTPPQKKQKKQKKKGGPQNPKG